MLDPMGSSSVYSPYSALKASRSRGTGPKGRRVCVENGRPRFGSACARGNRARTDVGGERQSALVPGKIDFNVRATDGDDPYNLMWWTPFAKFGGRGIITPSAARRRSRSAASSGRFFPNARSGTASSRRRRRTWRAARPVDMARSTIRCCATSPERHGYAACRRSRVPVRDRGSRGRHVSEAVGCAGIDPVVLRCRFPAPLLP